MSLLILPLLLFVIAAVIAWVMAKGDWRRGLKIYALAVLGLFVLSAGICALILSNVRLAG